MRSGEDVVLKVEELEAIRLKDLRGLNQEEAANKMDISQPTFHRTLVSAREKISDALVNGKAIKVSGGDYRLNSKELNSKDKKKRKKPSR